MPTIVVALQARNKRAGKNAAGGNGNPVRRGRRIADGGDSVNQLGGGEEVVATAGVSADPWQGPSCSCSFKVDNSCVLSAEEVIIVTVFINVRGRATISPVPKDQVNPAGRYYPP